MSQGVHSKTSSIFKTFNQKNTPKAGAVFQNVIDFPKKSSVIKESSEVTKRYVTKKFKKSTACLSFSTLTSPIGPIYTTLAVFTVGDVLKHSSPTVYTDLDLLLISVEQKISGGKDSIQ